MKPTTHIRKPWFFLAFFIVFLGTNLKLTAQTTLAEWTFDYAYDQGGTGPYSYTPNATARAAEDGLDINVNSGDIFYPNNADGTLTDYEMSMMPAVGGIIKNVYQGTTTYHNSARLQGVVAPADFTNPTNHANYFQFSFPTTGYNQIKLDLSYTTQNTETDILDVYYSVDEGATWASAGQASGNCCWWTLKTAQLDIVAKNKTNVLVRLIGVQEGETTGNYFYVDSFKVSGTSTTLPADTASTIDWAFDLGTEGQTATYTEASYYKPDNVSKGSNYSYFGTRAGTNPTVTYTSFKNETGASTPAGNDANNLIGFEFTPVTGLDFVPTSVSFDCQRYGTGSGLIDVYWKSSDGTSTLIAKDVKPAREGDATSEAADTSTFTMDVTSLSISALGGKSTLEIYIHSLGSGKEVGLANISITGNLNGTIEDVAQYTVTTASSPSEGGAIVSDNPATVDDGTVVNLTANANFGYEFAEWQDDMGATVSTDNPFQITVTEDVSLTGVFTAVTTYTLTLDIVGGANDYMVTASPNENSLSYEANETVTLTATNNPIFTFDSWSTGETTTSIDVTMDSDKTITANYSAADYILGWDFYKAGKAPRIATFSHAAENNAVELVLRDAAGNSAVGLDFSFESGSNWYGKNCSINWTNLADKYYYQIQFNASDYKDMSVQAALLSSYSGYPTQKCEYSIDGTNFTEIGSYDTSTLNTWVDGSFNLPADANNQAEVIIRWIPDYTTTPVDNGNDGTSISEIYVFGSQGQAPKNIAYVQKSGFTPAADASASTNDPIFRMFDADSNFDITVIETDADGTGLDLTGYDMVIAGETFGSGDGIWSGPFDIQTNTLPIIYNKTWAWQKSKNHIASAAASVVVSGETSVSVEMGNQGNDIFSGIDFAGGTELKLYNELADNDGATGSNAIDVLNNIEINTSGTNLATVADVTTNADSSVIINVIPQGTQIGTEVADVLQAPTIAFAFNYGAIIRGNGANITSEALTIWRNAAYILTGQTPPTTLYVNPDYDDTLGIDKIGEVSNVSSNVQAIGNRIYVSNVKSSTEVNIYSITGALVKSFKTNENTNFEFKSGLWIATVKTFEGTKAVKLLTR